MQFRFIFYNPFWFPFIADVGDLQVHYRKVHAAGDELSKDLLNHLRLDSIVDRLIYMPGCCPTQRYRNDQLHLLVYHTANCCQQFVCNECNDARFTNLGSIVKHYIETHKKSAEDITNEWHTTKRIFNDKPIKNMCISLPNGLIITRESIADNDFDTKLKSHLMEHIRVHIWEKEAATIRELCQL